MQELPYDTEDPICALATPWSPSALAVIRTSGTGAIDLLSRFFSRPKALQGAAGHTALHGQILDSHGQALDDVVVTVFRGPSSATGQDTVELSCHGSLPGLRRILETLTNGGFRPAGPGEFTLRGFLNGKLDLTKAEAVQEIVAAKTARAQSQAMERLSGRISERISALKDHILNVVALLNIQLDYAEDDVPDLPVPLEALSDVRDQIVLLADTYRSGRILQEGLRVALVGQTNAGKSSLFNAFLKEDRSIVSDEHGTTRDWLEAWVSVDGIPVRLIDTAGLREAENKVEREGIRRSREMVDAADVLLYLVDGTRGIDGQDQAFLDDHAQDQRLVVIHTKKDLVASPSTELLWISATDGVGFDSLEAALKSKIPTINEGGGGAVIDSLRQKQLLDRAAGALARVLEATKLDVPLDMIFVDVKDALDALGEITGEVTTSDVLTRMFSGFCVGK